MYVFHRYRVFILLALFCCVAGTGFGATIGTLVPVVGTVADLVYDEPRNVVYLANSSRNQVEIYSVAGARLTGSLPTGLQPSSLALSPDGNTLYVANIGSLTVTAINLISQQRITDYSIGSRPDAVAVGRDGRVVILGTAGLLRLDPLNGTVSAVPITPPLATPAGLPNIGATPTPVGFVAGLVPTASGSLLIGQSNNRIFVYEVASGTVLRSRMVTGLRTILSASRDGSRFMAGPFLFDTQTLTIAGRAGTIANTLTGGSAFSADGNAVYATFSTQPAINPLNPSNPQNPAAPGAAPGPAPAPPGGIQIPIPGFPGGGIVIPIPGGGAAGGGFPGGGGAVPGGGAGAPGTTPGTAGVGTQITRGVLQVMRSSSLAPQLGLRLPETITSKIIASTDGQYLFANSATGLLAIPIGRLSSLPLLDVSATNVVLSVDICNPSVATATVQVRNAGGGRMTYAASVNNVAAPVIVNRGSGVAPSSVTISFDPRSVGVRGTRQYAVVLSSPEAVNIEPAILVNVNFRDVSDRGEIVPLRGVGVDLQVDAPRQRLYIANYTQDQIEVFSLATKTFLPPIRVGNRPLSMAMIDPNTLAVANNGTEGVSLVDLEAMQEIEQIPMAPVPLNANPLFPRHIAASANAVLFSAVPLSAPGVAPGNNGAVWQLSRITHSAFPRLNLGSGTNNAVIQGRNMLIAPENGSAIVTVEGNGTIRMYDPIADTFTITRTQAVTGLRGTVTTAADGSFYVIDNLVFNSVLGAYGSIAPPAVGNNQQAQAAAAAFGVTSAGNGVIRIQASTPQAPVQSLQRFNLLTLQPDLQVNMPESVLDINLQTIGAANSTRQWPPRAVALELGVNNQVQLLRRGMVAHDNVVYALTYSGLSIVSMAPLGGRPPIFTANGVLNTASRRTGVSSGSLITITGINLADSATAAGPPLPRILAGVCVTANEVAIPLLSTSPTEINAQLPPELAAGRVTLTVRSTRLGLSSPGAQIQNSAASPGVFAVDVEGRQRAALLHAVDGMLVTPTYPARRDETLLLYVTGVGAVRPPVSAGQAGSSNPPSEAVQPVGVSIGGVPYLVTWAGLAPDMVGVYQINVYVPGNHVSGDDLPVIVTAGGSSSPSINAPVAAVQ